MKTRTRINYFSNIVSEDINFNPIFQTVRSTHKTFSLHSFSSHHIYIHPYPHMAHLKAYSDAVLKLFSDLDIAVTIHLSDGFWDGYTRSIRETSEAYSLQMEHDWVFRSRHITSGVEEIVSLMRKDGLPYLRFNKRQNGLVAGSILHTREVAGGPFAYCADNVMSNNPHFIDTEFYRREALPVLMRKKGTGSLGVEQELTDALARGASYGAAGLPATIRHIDGKMMHAKGEKSAFPRLSRSYVYLRNKFRALLD